MKPAIPKIPRRRLPDGQQGFAMLDALIATGILFWWLIAAAKLFGAWGDFQVAQMEGAHIAQYNQAVASYVANEPARLANLVPPQTLALPIHSEGVGWLQDAATCPGAAGAIPYLPCSYDPFSRVGLSFTTDIVQNGQYATATTHFGPALDGKAVDGAMGGAIVTAARGYAPTYSANLAQQYGLTGYGIDTGTGSLFATVDTARLGVPFLLTNGSNQMTGQLNMGGHHIAGAANITATGTVRGNNVSATNNVAAGKNVTAGQDMGAGRDLNAGRHVTSNTAGLGGKIQISGTAITLAGSLQASQYVNDGNWVLKPACPPDAPTPMLHISQSGFIVDAASEPILGMSLEAVENANRWDIKIYISNQSNPGGIRAGNSVRARATTFCQ